MRKIVERNKQFTKRQWELVWLMNTSFVEGDKRKERSQKRQRRKT